MLSILVTIPLIASLVIFVWGGYFKIEESFPGGRKLHVTLVITQLLVTFFFLVFSSLYTMKIIMASLYFVQGSGALFLLKKKGNVPCGCFGGQSDNRLSKKLVFFNYTFGILSLLSYFDRILFSPLEGVIVGGILSILCLISTIGIPDAIYAIKGFKKIAIKFYSVN